MPKKEKRLTRKQRQEQFGKGPSGKPSAESKHIHCIACGRHLDAAEFTSRIPSAARLTCAHGSQFAACSGCVPEAQRRLDEHDRTGQPPRIASVWH
jgi:hypothetical protein